VSARVGVPTTAVPELCLHQLPPGWHPCIRRPGHNGGHMPLPRTGVPHQFLTREVTA
jgi:hypothetical protein